MKKHHDYQIDVEIPMRDGVSLVANVWHPIDGESPTLLMRLPYSKDGAVPTFSYLPNILALLEAGYALVVQDCRGTFRSGGEFAPHALEARDGEDTIRWIVEQSWSDGKVGMYGASYLGIVQWEAAATGVGALKAIAPMFASFDPYEAPWYSPGGALSLSVVTSWNAMMYMLRSQRALDRGEDALDDLASLSGALMHADVTNEYVPTAENPALKQVGGWWDDFMSHPSHDDYWDEIAATSGPDKVTVPSLNVGGWYDAFMVQTVHAFAALRDRGGSEEARKESRLVVGPWNHEQASGVYPERVFGPMASSLFIDLTGLHVKFFNYWLRGDKSALDGVAPVKIFVMGLDQWRDERDFPLPDTTYVDYYLEGSGRANGSGGDGRLNSELPVDYAGDVIIYDPSDPVPTAGGACLPTTPGFGGPVDQGNVSMRDDVLCFVTPSLDKMVEVTGFVKLKLFVSSSALDTDVTAKLIDVFPDGKALNLCDGILRLRYRDGLHKAAFLRPGEVYEVEVDLAATSNQFLPGHRIRVDISSSNFPRYDRNTNSGGVIANDGAGDFTVATNTIHHGPDHPSRIVLPIIER